MIQKFIKKPLPIEAVKCTYENREAIMDLLGSGTTKWYPISSETNEDEIVGFQINSWEGVDPVYFDPAKNPNGNGKPYWIMKGLKGECCPCVADDVEDAPLGYTAAQ